MYEVIMPKLGLTMETGVIEKWHKKEGDTVESGEVLFEVMTDKVSLEVEAYNSGVLRKILRKEGEEVPVTEVIAFIGEAGEEIPSVDAAASLADSEKSEEAAKEPEPALSAAASPESQEASTSSIKISPLARNIAASKGIDITKIKGTGPGGRIVKEDVENFVPGSISQETSAKVEAAQPQEAEGRIKISPLARSLAKEHGIDYTKVAIKGTGPQGRIVKEDILAYAESIKSKPAAAPAASIPMQAAKVKSSAPLKGIRKVIAERMVYAKQTIPHIIPTSVMDATALVSLRDRIKDRVKALHGSNITYTDFITKACAIALSEHPEINASLIDNEHIIYEDINIGLGVSIDAGLIVPTIYGADRLSLFDIAKKRSELIEKAKASKLSMEEISNGTFTISNLGMLGVRNFTAIINPPQGAILMVGEIFKTPAVVDDKIEIRQQMEISIAVDHRIIDGADAAKFLLKLKELIESPEILLI